MWTEGKMMGVLVCADTQGGLCYVTAFSGQNEVLGEDAFFCPPVYDYSAPTHPFQQEQQQIVALSAALADKERERSTLAATYESHPLRMQRQQAVEAAQQAYREGRLRRERLRSQSATDEGALVRESQFQQAEIRRARQLHAEVLGDMEVRLAQFGVEVETLRRVRRERSEALQQWLFDHFVFQNARGEERALHDLFAGREIPSGAGECCAPKMLQTAYRCGLRPLAMAEFWWGTMTEERVAGAFYPSCRTKCKPILAFMLQGLTVETDPAAHYDERQGELRILWEDEDVVVVEKPAGMLSVPGRSDATSVYDEILRRYPAASGPVVVHRLDMDTSGVMVVVKTRRAYHVLQRQFLQREVQKRYVAVVEGCPAVQEGVISLPLSPDYDNLPAQRVDQEHGDEAVTRFEVVGRMTESTSRVVFYPLTGRTHQLRVHAASARGLGCPIVGDRLYGHVGTRLCLHAERITFVHPTTGEEMTFCAPCPF